MKQPHAILDFWFGTLDLKGNAPAEKQSRWWKKSPDFDRLCKAEFEEELRAAVAGERSELQESPHGSLAFILLCDQIPRNIFRDTPAAFASDSLALSTTKKLLEDDNFDDFQPVERSFAYMPLMHSEDPAVQALSVECFTLLRELGHDNVSFAQRHKDIVDRFGRFPHRNQILGRQSTLEELAFLKEPGSSF